MSKQTLCQLARRATFFGVVAILVVTPTQYGFEVMDQATLSLVDPLIWLTFLAWLMHEYAAACDRHALPSPPSWPARLCAPLRGMLAPLPPAHGLLVVLAALSIPRAFNRVHALKDVFQWTEYFIVGFLLLTGALNRIISKRAFVWLMLGTGAAVILTGIVQYAMPDLDALAVRATFGNRNVFGGYLAMMIPLAFGLLLYDRHPARRLGYGALMAAGSVCLLAGGSFLAAAIGVAAVAAAKGGKTFLLAMAVFILCLGVAQPHLPRDNAAECHDSIVIFDPQTEHGLTPRYSEWQAALTLIADNPWRGVGMGNYQENIGLYYGILPDIAEAAEPDSQNLYLVIGSEIGLPGLAVFIGMLLHAMRLALRQAVHATDRFSRGLALGVFGALIGFSINSLWSPLLVRGTGVVLVLLLALAAQSANGFTARK